MRTILAMFVYFGFGIGLATKAGTLGFSLSLQIGCVLVWPFILGAGVDGAWLQQTLTQPLN